MTTSSSERKSNPVAYETAELPRPAAGMEIAYEEVIDDTRLKQGDIIEWTNDQGERRNGDIGVIITADCDLVQDKHRGVITYVPIVRIDTYLLDLYIPDQLKKELDKLRKKMLENTNSQRSEDHKSRFPQGLSEDAIRIALSSQDSAFFSNCGIRDVNARAIKKMFDVIEAWDCRIGAITGETWVQCAKEIRESTLSTTNYDPIKEFSTAFKTHLRNLPQDLMYLNTVSANHNGGYIVHLRQIREASVDSIMTHFEPVLTNRLHVRRISRLKPTYRHRLTQMIANLFARIGLPGYYEAQRDSEAVTVIQKYANSTFSEGDK